ncbi:MAG TPA: DUF2071 domain-containing protein [Flavobacterium sp.]|jgi:hypothetical protein
MKALKILNTIAIGIPVFLVLIEGQLSLLVIFSTVVTGFIQVLIGSILFFKNPRDPYIVVYLILVATFFILINILGENKYKILLMPLYLCIYLSIIVYTRKNKNNPFLTAEWNDLVVINYKIDPKILESYIPTGTVIDLWNEKCYISLIGFMFENVKVLGIKIPFHVNFEEVNLRFYVKRLENNEWKRGVVFIKEIVPKHAISTVANTLYKEHYETLKMRHSKTENETSKVFRYEWQKDKKWNTITMQTAKNPFLIAPGSEAEFITEHYFGYTQYSKNKTIEYGVTHPRWEQLEVINYTIDVDFESTYGSDFAFLQNVQPVSTFLALGSKITIEGKKIIK